MNWCWTVEQCENACKALWCLLAARGERKAADNFHILLFSSPAVPQPVSCLEEPLKMYHKHLKHHRLHSFTKFLLSFNSLFVRAIS